MARLEAIAKGLYYPTPLRVIDFIAGMVEPAPVVPGVPWRILDVCAGEGDAVARLAEAWNLEAYGVELDAARAAAANGKLKICFHGSYHQLKAEAAFQALFLNPPYDWGERDGVTSRQEVQFLMDAVQWLQPGGLLVFVPPRHVLEIPAFRDFMRQHFTNIHALSFPEPEVGAFDQVIVIAKWGGGGFRYGSIAAIENPGELEAIGPHSRYNDFDFKLLNPAALDTFDLDGFDPVSAAPSWDPEHPTWGYSTPQWDILVGERGSLATRPLVAPRPGHQAMLLAAGALDGAELASGQLLKGGSEKIVVEIAEEDATIERDRIVSRLSVLDLRTGEYETWRADEDPERTARWFEENGPDLARAIQSAYTPSFDGDLGSFQDALSGMTAPGLLPGRSEPEFLLQQQEAAAATAFWWGRGAKSAVISGEMGTGKTSMAILATQLAKCDRTVVMCPSHLVPKWIRECEKITGRKGIAVTARDIGDVDAFFASERAQYLILSKEMAKLGARWTPAFQTRTIIVEKEVPDLDADRRDYRYGYGWGYSQPVPMKTVREKIEVVICPDCGATQAVEGIHLTPAAFDRKVQRSCLECRAPMWQSTPISAKGTKRWPLAHHINRRYKRRYALVMDECHQYAGANSDQSKAAQDLCSGARKILAMTGTFYGGRASSIFHLLFKVDAQFRQMYGYSECDRFVAHHGLFERRYEEEERTSVYGYRRGGKRSGGRIREIPGMSPAMIPLILPYTLFVKLKDLRLELPPYEERVELLEHDADIRNAASRLMGDVKNVLRKHSDILGQYLMACLGYPDCPEQEERIVSHNEETGMDELIATAPAFPQRVLPKDQRVVEIAKEEKAAGRQVLVYFTQTHRRDARMRVKAALEAEGLRVAVLDANVAPDKREEWLEKAQKTGFDVMLTNGRLVETGMDLLFAATIIQYGTEYSVPSLRQSIRRSWRLGQIKPIKVIFLAYRETMQEAAIGLIARKMRAAEMVDGDENGGLAQFDESGTNFFVELAHEAIAGTRVPASTSFAEHAVLG